MQLRGLLLSVVSAFVILTVAYQFRCASADEKLQMPQPSSSTTPSSFTIDIEKGNSDVFSRRAKFDEKFRSLRLNMLGGGSRNMTINLSNLVVLGLGMAAAVSLFSFFETPGTGFLGRSAPSEFEDGIIYLVAPLVDNIITTIFDDEPDKKIVSEVKQKFGNWLNRNNYNSKFTMDDVRYEWDNKKDSWGDLSISGLETKKDSKNDKT